MDQQNVSIEMRIRLRLPSGEVLGYGKAELLAHISNEGSISAAGRKMNMSYKRAWQLVETMNNMFSQPLVESARGGLKGGGARLTNAGEVILSAYKAIQNNSENASDAELRKILDMFD